MVHPPLLETSWAGGFDDPDVDCEFVWQPVMGRERDCH